MKETLVKRSRHSPLPPMLVLWFVVALSLFRSESMPNVFKNLVGVMRGLAPGLPLKTVVDSALCHARKRLGAAPLR